MSRKETPSQTVGPFFAYGLTPTQYGYQLASIAGSRIAGEHEPGEHIRIAGQVFDGEGSTIPDAMIEIWQADALGRYAHPADPRRPNADFKGFGRVGTGVDGAARFSFETIKPGSIDGEQAPHLNLIVTMRGLLNHLYTRLYFPDEDTANARDPVLSLVPQARRSTLIAKRVTTAEGDIYRFDIHMQGELETVFFDF